jgi:hypothetical protein
MEGELISCILQICCSLIISIAIDSIEDFGAYCSHSKNVKFVVIEQYSRDLPTLIDAKLHCTDGSN